MLPVGVFFYDFAKAFDKVEHRRLLAKVKSVGIKGDLLEWIAQWLTGRKQRVVVEGEYLEWTDVLSSVVQGSVLGPLLFIIFIDDIDNDSKVRCSKFADDTKQAKVVRSQEEAEEFQEEERRMEAWAGKWSMLFNEDKCKVMHLGSRNSKHHYEMNGKPLAETEVEKDLGVLISRT